jgi:ABC-type bacteriocin/lantibiotic exporter with double-glycine peptidase domain
LPKEWIEKRFACGPNSLYLFLRLQGRPVSAEAVWKEVPLGAQGASLLDLKEASARLGVPSAVYRGSWEELARCPKPAIAFLRLDMNGTEVGHYVVVLSVDGQKNVDFIDGTDGLLYRNRSGFFHKKWTGHFLTPEPSGGLHLGVGVSLACWLGLGLFVWSVARRRRRPRAAPTASQPLHSHS